VSLRGRLPDPLSVVAVAFAMVMVMSAALAGGFGPVAQNTAEDVSPAGEADALIIPTDGVMCTIDLTRGCGGDSEVETTTASETKQKKLDLYSSLVSQHETADTFLAGKRNFLAHSQAVASMKAKARMIELINAGGATNATYVKNELDRVIEDYYAVRERNLLARYNQQIAQLAYTVETAKNDSGISGTWVTLAETGVTASSDGDTDHFKAWSHTTNQSYTLLNGTSVNKTMYVQDWKTGDNYINDYKWGIGRSVYEYYDDYERANGTVQVGGVSDSSWNASKNLTATGVFEVGPYDTLLNQIGSEATDLKTQYNQSFVDQVITAYDAGEINTTDITTPEMLASEFATSYNQSGAAAYQWGTLAALGLDSPDIQNTSHITVDYQKTLPHDKTYVAVSGTPTAEQVTLRVDGESISKEYLLADANGTYSQVVDAPVTASVMLHGEQDNKEPLNLNDGSSQSYGGVNIETRSTVNVTESGMLFARDAPEGGYQVNGTYDADNRSMYFAPAGENTSIQRLRGNVGVTGAEDRQGNELDTVRTRDYNYQTNNVTRLEEQLNQLEELRKEIESREPLAGGGGGADSGGGSQMVLIAILAVVAAAVVVNNRAQQGGGRDGR